MTSAGDYGKHDSPTALVPEALTAYRHFMLSETGLGSMGLEASYDSPGVYEAECKASPAVTSKCGVPGCPFCDREKDRHPSPDLSCRCGFYAHYAPESDFYPETRWVYPTSYQNTMGQPLSSVSQWATYAYGWKAQPIIRSVVEMSGKVVVGRLGVRAQKMRIKAVAVDWRKYRYGDDGGGVQAATEAQLVTVARQLEAEYFASPDEMYKAYPQPDISHLLPEPAPPEPELEFTSYPGQGPYPGQVTVTINASSTIGKALKQVQDSLAASLSSASFSIDTLTTYLPAEDDRHPMQRALEAKQNRPANPGAIDYRRRNER